MVNIISDRVAYFLKDFPPFSFLKEEEQAHIAEQATVKFYRPGEAIFSEGEQGLGSCFVLHKGNVKLIKKVEGIDQLVDQCEPGDIFGVRSLLSGNPYVMSATVEEETLVYAIPQKVFEHYLDSQQQFARYFAAGYAAGQVIVRTDQNKESVKLPSTASFENEQLQFSNKVVTCEESATIQEAAKLMQSHKVGSIIVASDKGEPIGIVTDTDLRNRVVAEGVATNQLISKIMTSPVKTVSPVITLGEAMGRMISQKVHHLVVTKDGTDQSKLAGIISDHDVMLSQKNHPAALIKAIKRSDSIEEWASIRSEADTLLNTYLKQEVSISLVSGLISTINETIIEKTIQKGVKEIFKTEAADFCWMHLGSEGREEQLLRTDQDNAIIYSDASEDQRERYLTLGRYVNDVLATCGFEVCPAEVMARNSSYNLSLSGWKNLFDQWIKTPDPKSLMNATIFFDFRMGEGNSELVLELQEYLASQLKKHDVFLNHLAANALQNPPPLSFFKGFVVERSGEHKNDFDIKKASNDATQ